MGIMEYLPRAFAWIAFFAWVAAESARAIQPWPAGRRWWKLAAAALLLHTAAVFQWRHHWSHAAAVADTARQTLEITGSPWGGGIWLNYAMVLLWSAEVLGVHGREALLFPSRIHLALRWFFAFMWLNAAVIFAHGPLRWLGGAGFAILAGLLWRRYRSSFRADRGRWGTWE